MSFWTLISFVSLVLSVLILVAAWRMMQALETIADMARFMLDEMTRRGEASPQKDHG